MARTARAARAATAPRAPRRNALAFDALLVEGALIAPAQLANIAALDAGDQKPPDYAVPKGLDLRDELPRFYRIGQALFAELAASPHPSQAATISFTRALLKDVFGFNDLAPHPGVTLTALDGRVPVVVVPPDEGLDRPSAAASAMAGHRTSAALAVQDWLNARDGALWGFACNGERLRLLRDNPSLTRPAYIEADLRRIFEADALADFAALWLLMHASRFGAAAAPPSDCILERWRDAGQKAGETARERLRDGVEQALQEIGDGLLRHPANASLRDRLADGSLPLPTFFNQLLRLIYRMIFLLAAEDRGLLHPPAAPPAVRTLYATGYGLSRLRDRAIRPAAWDVHDDLWDGLCILFGALARGEPRLGLPALDGLFAYGETPDLDEASLSNRALLKAVRGLAWLDGYGAPVPVNWRDMETEELGSVYEALLELTPILTEDGRGFAFADSLATRGNQRKSTSSYYTKDSLVQTLLKLTVDPVADKILSEAEEPAEALLRLKLLDPACGSGHFLLAAGRHIAARLARVRAGGTAGAEEYRHALRDVARNCLHGVDRNPMAVELTKVALWIETIDPGKPLGFLDANIRCGDALLGISDLTSLQKGIPEGAYKALEGDDKPTATYFKNRNRDDLTGQGGLDFDRGGGKLPTAAPLARESAALRALPEDSPEQIADKRRRFGEVRASRLNYAFGEAADLFVAAFLLPKTGGPPPIGAEPQVPTSQNVWRALDDKQVHPPLIASAVETSRQARAFHWPLEFPDIMASGGFDVILGNPPWDTMSPDAKEFFSPYDEQIRVMSPDDQEARIKELLALPGLSQGWEAYCRHLYTLANFLKESGRYTLFAQGNLGKGDFNVYRMFVELALRLTKPGGRAAQFVPENLYNGANASAIRRHLFSKCKLHTLIAFENTRKVWFDIHTAAKFCLYVAIPGQSTDDFTAAFGVNSEEKLAALQTTLPLHIPVALVEEFSPEAFAIAEVAHPADIEVSRKLYARLPKFGARIAGAASRQYMTELHMGNDRDDFSTGADGVAVYEGRMIEAFDHRAKAYVSGRGRSALWRELPFNSNEKQITPQWHIALDSVPDKVETRWQDYRVAFCDVGGVTNARFLMTALVPPGVVCGHSVPTIVFNPPDDRLCVLWLAVTNAFCTDYLARKKAALHMTYTVLDSLPLPRVYNATPLEDAIAQRSLRLTATGEEMADFWNRAAPLVGLDSTVDRPCEISSERDLLRAELDVLVARDFFGLSRDEMRYLLDPADILSDGCGFETFGALKRAEARTSGGKFTSRDAIMKQWEELPRPASAAKPALPVIARSDGELAAKAHSDGSRGSVVTSDT